MSTAICVARSCCRIAAKFLGNEPQPRTDQRARNEAAIRLLNEWLADESGYDEQVWPTVERSLEENRLSYL